MKLLPVLFLLSCYSGKPNKYQVGDCLNDPRNGRGPLVTTTYKLVLDVRPEGYYLCEGDEQSKHWYLCAVAEDSYEFNRHWDKVECPDYSLEMN
jgi:hypothetical protein